MSDVTSVLPLTLGSEEAVQLFPGAVRSPVLHIQTVRCSRSTCSFESTCNTAHSPYRRSRPPLDCKGRGAKHQGLPARMGSRERKLPREPSSDLHMRQAAAWTQPQAPSPTIHPCWLWAQSLGKIVFMVPLRCIYLLTNLPVYVFNRLLSL